MSRLRLGLCKQHTRQCILRIRGVASPLHTTALLHLPAGCDSLSLPGACFHTCTHGLTHTQTQTCTDSFMHMPTRSHIIISAVAADVGLVTRTDRAVAVCLGQRSVGHRHEEAFQHPITTADLPSCFLVDKTSLHCPALHCTQLIFLLWKHQISPCLTYLFVFSCQRSKQACAPTLVVILQRQD